MRNHPSYFYIHRSSSCYLIPRVPKDSAAPLGRAWPRHSPAARRSCQRHTASARGCLRSPRCNRLRRRRPPPARQSCPRHPAAARGLLRCPHCCNRLRPSPQHHHAHARGPLHSPLAASHPDQLLNASATFSPGALYAAKERLAHRSPSCLFGNLVPFLMQTSPMLNKLQW